MKPIDEERVLELAHHASDGLNGLLTVTEAFTVIKAKGRVCLFVGTKAGARILVMNAEPPDRENAYQETVETNLNACREAGADKTAILIKRSQFNDSLGSVAIAISSNDGLRTAILDRQDPRPVALGPSKPGWFSALFYSPDVAKETG